MDIGHIVILNTDADTDTKTKNTGETKICIDTETDTDLRTLLIQCQEDERAHRNLGDTYGAQRAPRSLHTLIRWGTRLAISLARRI